VGPDGRRAPQKCCWVQYGEPMEEDEYVRRQYAGQLVLQPCPGCGGQLVAWGQFARQVVSAGGRTVHALALLRGRCRNPDCPVCTGTHYPSFLTPYPAVPTAQREEVVRQRAEGQSSSELAAGTGYDRRTVVRWVRGVLARARGVTQGMLAIWQRLDVQAPEPVPGVAGELRAMFWLCDAVAALLRGREGWVTDPPRLAVPRVFRPPAPTTLPVWT
jgi:DNA-binding CsgD family transcriptional regulator